MRSGKIMTRKISAVEVSSHAKRWIDPHLKFEDAGPKCKASVVLGVLLIAASKLSSIFAACRDLANPAAISNEIKPTMRQRVANCPPPIIAPQA